MADHGSDGATAEQARVLAATLRKLLDWARAEAREEHNEVVELVTGFLGDRARGHSVLTRALPTFEHVNLQTALDAWCGRPGREVEVRGITTPPHFGPVSLQQLITGEGLPPLRLSAPPLVDLPNGPGSTLACLLRAVLLVADDRGRYVVLVSGPSEHDASLTLEIAGLPVATAQQVYAELDELRRGLNVYRGHLLEVTLSPRGEMSLGFGDVPLTVRDEVVLPEEVLGRVERHALGVSTHRDALRAAGQHLKRGLLLYGPPGTGKTHTTRYVMGRLHDYTRILLTGRTLHVVGAATELARELQPAAVVLEDVDLVAEDRSFGPGSSPVLFDLLDAMDGAAADADLLFVLTTNRADLLEPALAARPGRVDVAVEIALPDAGARRRLFDLAARGTTIALTTDEYDEVVARTEGVTASFLKELVRRAVLGALESGTTTVAADDVRAALDDLLDGAQRLTRSLLGVGNDPDTLPPGGGAGSLPPGPRPAPAGWVSYAPIGRMPRRYRG